jgi:hypothetical protein
MKENWVQRAFNGLSNILIKAEVVSTVDEVMQILRSPFQKVMDMSPLHLVGKKFIALEGVTLHDLGKNPKENDHIIASMQN